MEWKLFFTVFASVFLAELADKTQLATALFAADRNVSKLTVFAGASMALIVSSAIAVTAGAALARWVDPSKMAIAAGCGFVLIGVWVIWQGMNLTS